jgi:hypothetical protein
MDKVQKPSISEWCYLMYKPNKYFDSCFYVDKPDQMAYVGSHDLSNLYETVAIMSVWSINPITNPNPITHTHDIIKGIIHYEFNPTKQSIRHVTLMFFNVCGNGFIRKDLIF